MTAPSFDADPALPPVYEAILPRADMPGQYVGGEHNACVKPDATLRMALAFPEPYTVGMSHHGTRIFYESLNALEDVSAERAFVPMPDMEALLRGRGEPLRTLETFTPLGACDAVCVSLQHELTATGLLTLLDLGGIPLLRTERGDGVPLVLAGGHAAMNPEPLSDFVDLFLIGEGEEAILEMARILLAMKGASRAETLLRMAREVAGAYVPSLYATEADAEGMVRVTGGLSGAPYPVRQRMFEGFAASANPQRPVVPVVETVHERVTLEIMRGCPHGCRFCQAGMIMRPMRARSVEALARDAAACYRATGYDEIGLLSLSTSDYPDFDRLVETLDQTFAPKAVSLSLPSLRVDHALSDIPKRFRTVRKSGLTLAPEAGTDRLRRAINKKVTHDDLLAAAHEAYKQGWQTIKLYFMVGLPTETEADVEAIAALANETARQRTTRGRGTAVTCSVSNFVPKPHTPFQWDALDPAAVFAEKQERIGRLLDRKRVSFKGHDPQMSRLEGILARGDRRLGAVILDAWRRGARLDAWGDHFQPALWDAAFAAAGIDPDATYAGARSMAVPLPWSHVVCGVSTTFLKRERTRCDEEAFTPSCGDGACVGCGVEGCALARGR